MSKKTRQYIGLLSAIIAYYIIHEGAHFVYALITGVFKEIKFMGLGMQIDIYAEKYTDIQMGMFCIIGSVATFITAYLLIFLSNRIVKAKSKPFKACMYYITIAMLLLDPLYLSLLCNIYYLICADQFVYCNMKVFCKCFERINARISSPRFPF